MPTINVESLIDDLIFIADEMQKYQSFGGVIRPDDESLSLIAALCDYRIREYDLGKAAVRRLDGVVHD